MQICIYVFIYIVFQIFTYFSHTFDKYFHPKFSTYWFKYGILIISVWAILVSISLTYLGVILIKNFIKEWRRKRQS